MRMSVVGSNRGTVLPEKDEEIVLEDFAVTL